MSTHSGSRRGPGLGLALGGGAARGAAHIGVLRALRESKLPPDFIAGTSIGALVGGLYAAGVDLDDLSKAASSMDWLDVAGASLSRFGLLSNQQVKKLVTKLVGERNIEDLEIPFAAMTTDISTGESVLLKSGSLADAVMASTCVPGVFAPTKLDGRMLVDGGLVENVPVSAVRSMGAEVVVAVNINGSHSYETPKNLIDVLLNAIDIALDNTTKIQLQKADVRIELKLAQYSRTDGDDSRELIAEGYRGAMLKCKEIEQALDELAPTSWQVMEDKFREWWDSA